MLHFFVGTFLQDLQEFQTTATTQPPWSKHQDPLLCFSLNLCKEVKGIPQSLLGKSSQSTWDLCKIVWIPSPGNVGHLNHSLNSSLKSTIIWFIPSSLRTLLHSHFLIHWQKDQNIKKFRVELSQPTRRIASNFRKMLHVHVGVSKRILRMNHGNIDEFWEMSLRVCLFLAILSWRKYTVHRPWTAGECIKNPHGSPADRIWNQNQAVCSAMNLIIPNTNGKSSYTYCISNPNPLDKLSSSCLMLLYSNGPRKQNGYIYLGTSGHVCWCSSHPAYHHVFRLCI